FYVRNADGALQPYPDPMQPGQPLTLTSADTPISLLLSPRADLYIRQIHAPEGYLMEDTFYPLTLPQTLTIVNDTRGVLFVESFETSID
ncbi:MAG: hypothetical protein RR482_04575, partial [Clostridia bacterium]